ncbi:divergent PAP2 family protein [Candidatus Saccharibacteria bacterium]|nr:divergent PAP2 family protein [Candidatus Saccharibacteria bacterium]
MIGMVENKSIWFLFLAFALGWFIAQFWKLIAGLVEKGKPLTFSEVVYFMSKSGGMPSGHTASFTGLTTAIGLLYGFDQPVFALAACTTVIFIYDATNVRFAVGEHGKLLNEIAESDGNPLTKPQKIVEGHTVPQVIVGIIIGIAIGFLTFLLAGGHFD